MPKVILVDKEDKPIGEEEKLLAHQKGLLHRAFSIFILHQMENGIETLLQQRQLNKYHGGGLWTNTCCSHPEPNETILNAASRRLKEEMGFTVPLNEIGVFTYRAEFSNGLIEHEVDHVLVGFFDGSIAINPNKEEVENYKWLSLDKAEEECKAAPECFTPWFAQALSLIKKWVQDGNG